MHKPVGGDDPQHRPEERNDHAFNQHLVKDRQAGGADGFANPDLADAFVDARQHDVHDPNAAHHEADGGDDASAQARVANLLVDGLELVFLGAETEVLDARDGSAGHVASLLQRRFQGLRSVTFMSMLDKWVGMPFRSDAARNEARRC